MDRINRERRRRIQQREDDEEDWIQGDRRKQKNNSGLRELSIFATVVGALSLGATVLYKAFFGESSETSLAETSTKCLELINEMSKDLSEYPVLGLNLEAAILQLSTYNDKTLLIPLQKIGNELPNEVRDILNNREIIKTGVDILKTTKMLHDDYNLEITAAFDLRFLVEDTGNRPENLEKLSKNILGLDLDHRSHQIAFDEASVKATINIFKTLYIFVNPHPDQSNILSYCASRLDHQFEWCNQKWGNI